MAIPRNKRRLIVVDGQAYHWAFSVSLNQAENIMRVNLTVMLAQDGPKSRLSGQDQFWWNGQKERIWGRYHKDTGGIACFSKNVEIFIKDAIQGGWQPHSLTDFPVHSMAKYCTTYGEDGRRRLEEGRVPAEDRLPPT